MGMRGFPGNPVPTAALKSTQWAADVIYTPVDTEFIRAAAAKGCRVMSGGGKSSGRCTGSMANTALGGWGWGMALLTR